MISKEKILRIIREETLSREAKRRIKISTIDKLLNQILSNHKFDENKSVEFNTMLVLGLVMFAVIDEFGREEFPEFQEELRNFILDRYKVSVEKFFVDKGLGL
jgi:ATP-dependent exoDNAse (exonuclease V) beta subunit